MAFLFCRMQQMNALLYEVNLNLEIMLAANMDVLMAFNNVAN